MPLDDSKTRILFFIGSLRSGGKERRLIELLTYLKKKGTFEMMVVATKGDVHFPAFYKLDIPFKVIKKKSTSNDLTIFYRFHKLCKSFNPHLIHTWGRMQSFYTLPSALFQGIPVVNSQITGAPTITNKWSPLTLIDKFNFRFSRFVLSNSKAGLDTYKPPARKSKVIYNGINLNRFVGLPDVAQVRAKYGIKTPYAVLMSASFSPYKNYNLFFKVAEYVIGLRDDITFIGVGGYEDENEYKRMLQLSAQNPKILFPGRIDDVEALVNACTVGVLFSTNGEGISNSIMEYMALAKPVIASAPGGTKEIVHHNENGYLITHESAEEIGALIIDLINDKEKYDAFGRQSKRIIEESFSLEKMGQAFEQTYKDALVQ